MALPLQVLPSNKGQAWQHHAKLRTPRWGNTFRLYSVEHLNTKNFFLLLLIHEWQRKLEWWGEALALAWGRIFSSVSVLQFQTARLRQCQEQERMMWASGHHFYWKLSRRTGEGEGILIFTTNKALHERNRIPETLSICGRQDFSVLCTLAGGQECLETTAACFLLMPSAGWTARLRLGSPRQRHTLTEKPSQIFTQQHLQGKPLRKTEYLFFKM